MLNHLPGYWFKDTGKTQRRSVSTVNGSVSVTYADNLTNLAMRVVPGGGGENGGQERLNSQNPNRIYVSGAPDIVTTDRVVFSSSVYDVLSVNNFDENATYMRLDCVEVKPSGEGA